MVFEVGNCEFISEITGQNIKCSVEIEENEGLIAAYWMGTKKKACPRNLNDAAGNWEKLAKKTYGGTVIRSFHIN